MKLIPNAVTVKCARQLLVGKKHSPTLLFGAGVVGVIGTTVLACKATLKLEETIFEIQSDLRAPEAKIATNNPKFADYTEKDAKREVALAYMHGGLKIAKLYAPSVVLGVASVSALTASHKILSQRNMALTAAYTALDKGFNEYRARVVEKYGEQQDREFRYETEQVEITDDKGKKKKVTRAAPGAESIYARFFDQNSANWNETPEYNLVFLKAQQNYCNDLLRSRGHLFLNEVYKMLDIPHSGAGAVVGWVMGNGDNYVDFGVFDDNENARDFVNGFEGSILLDFNVDGVIWDKIDDYQRGDRLSWQS